MSFQRRVKIKICGITSAADALNAVKAGADALGFVFFRQSPRYVSPAKARGIIRKLPASVNKVGVFVNEKPEKVIRIARQCGLDTLQFHAEETAGYCRKFPGYKIIKAFRIKDASSLKEIKKYQVDGYLMDTFSEKSYGGTGKIFRWVLLQKLSGKIFPLILSGGLNPGNIARAIKKVKPYAVDVSSGVEISPGKKSPKLLKQLFKAITAA
jgi:phosphoribosylanthranilate isomerase